MVKQAMLWNMIKKELLLNLMTFKFALCTILCVALVGGLMSILAKEYQKKSAEYDQTQLANETSLRNTKVYRHILSSGLYASLPPDTLSVFHRGVSSQICDSYRIALDGMPYLSGRSIHVNPYIAALPVLDISLVMRLILSLLALLVGYDAINGEREKGTLKLILSGRAARVQVLVSKYVAGLLTLAIPLVLALTVGVLVLESSPYIHLNLSQWGRIGLIGVVSLVFVSTMISLGIWISCMTSRSSTSLVVSLFLWTMFVVVIPNTGTHVATKLCPLPPHDQMRSQLNQIEDQQQKDIDRIYEQVPWHGQEVEQGQAYHVYVLTATADALDCRAKRSMRFNDLYIEGADQEWDIERAYEQALDRQRQLAENLARISPISIFDRAMSVLAGTDVGAMQRFLVAARSYREQVVDYLRTQTNNFSSHTWFSRCREQDTRFYQEYLQQKVSQQAFEAWKKKRVSQIKPLGLEDFPRFIYHAEIMAALASIGVDMGWLFLVNTVCLTGSLFFLQRYDVR